MGIIQRLLAQRVIGERRSSTFTTTSPLTSWRDDYRSAAGVVVNSRTAMNVIAVQACVRILAESLAAMPLILYRRGADGKRERATEHPLYPILHDVPNPWMDSYTLREVMMYHLTLHGNAYAEITFDGAGRITGLWPLRADRMMAITIDDEGRLWYSYQRRNGGIETVPQDLVFHVRWLSPNGIIGESPIRYARDAIGLAKAAETYGAAFFRNGAKASTVLLYPGKLSTDAITNLRESWERRHRGVENAHKVAILEEGMDIKTISVPPDDAQYLETRRFQIEEIARMFRVPPHMLADLSRATFSNVEQMSIEFVQNTLVPWMRRWEQAITHQLLLPRERNAYYAEFLADSLLRGDTLSRFQAYAIAIQWGVMTANEVRARENLGPVEGGDERLIPLNMIPATNLHNQGAMAMRHLAILDETRRAALPAPPTLSHADWRVDHPHGYQSAVERRRITRTYQRLYRDAFERSLRRERSDIQRMIRKLKPFDAKRFGDAVNAYYQEHQEYLLRSFRPLAQSLGVQIVDVIGKEIGARGWTGGERRESELTPPIEAFIEAYLAEFARRHGARQAAALRRAVERAIANGDDPVTVIEALTEGWPDRAGSEAQDETTRFNGAIAVAAYSAAHVRALRWVTFDRSCPYCQAMDGKVIEITGYFVQEGTALHPDGAEHPLRVNRNTRHPPLHGGCDCSVIAAHV